MSPASAAGSICGPTRKSIGGRGQPNLDRDLDMVAIGEAFSSEELPTSGDWL